MSRSSTRLVIQITLIIVGYYLLPLTQALHGAVVWLRVLAGLATVGFGDIHAKGQLARLLVIAQILFNVVVLAAAFRVLAGAARARRG